MHKPSHSSAKLAIHKPPPTNLLNRLHPARCYPHLRRLPTSYLLLSQPTQEDATSISPVTQHQSLAPEVRHFRLSVASVWTQTDAAEFFVVVTAASDDPLPLAVVSRII